MIKEGDYVMFEKAKILKVFPVKKNKPIMIDRNKTKLDNLIGQPFGYQYEIKDRDMYMKIEKNEEKKAIELTSDNRNLLDLDSNQKLSREEIEKMKKDMQNSEITGTEVINKIIENSSSFSNKTEYSQEKYVKKKKAKYLAQYAVLKPTIRNLCNFYVQGHNKKKILNMRMDTIAQMLTYANLAAFRNVMVLENCKGLILAAVVERIGGHGKIVNFSPNGSHMAAKETLDCMNFPSEVTKNLYNYPLEQCHRPEVYIEHVKGRIEAATENENYRNKKIEQLKTAEIVNDLFKNRSMDCLVIATKYRPLPILQKTIEYMGYNRYFVIYSNTIEPLIECHSWLKINQRAIHVELSDSWLRQYQILPERTHPTVMMDCHGGYILTGITVTNSN